MIRIKDYIFSKENQLPCTCIIVRPSYIERIKWYTIEEIKEIKEENKND